MLLRWKETGQAEEGSFDVETTLAELTHVTDFVLRWISDTLALCLPITLLFAG